MSTPIPSADRRDADGIAQKLGAAVARWALTEMADVADGPTSRVLRARSGGHDVAVKLLKPYGADEIHGAELMVWYGGLGSAEILDIADGTILMEWLDGAPLADMVRGDHDRDAEAAGVLCDVVGELHRRRPQPVPLLTPLDRWLEPLRDTDFGFLGEAHGALARRTQPLLRDLLATTTDTLPLHGDFHHDNVVHGRRGWLVIDPKGLIGDPHYELANVFRNPYGAGELAARPERIGMLADMFSARLGLDRRRLLQWAAVHAAISAVWDHAAGQDPGFNLIVLPLLLDAAER